MDGEERLALGTRLWIGSCGHICEWARDEFGVSIAEDVLCCSCWALNYNDMEVTRPICRRRQKERIREKHNTDPDS